MRIIRTIKIDTDKCTGCRACELACAGFHAEPKYSTINPKRSRIRVQRDEQNKLFVPVKAGPYTEAECSGRNILVIKGKEYGECSFCRSACPARDLFKEPDSGLPLKCDMCGEPAPEEPLCVKWCLPGALTFHKRVEENGPVLPAEAEYADEVEEL